MPTLTLLFLSSALFLLSACTVIPVDVAFAPDPAISTVWPQSPEIPRIKLLRIIRGPRDVIPDKRGVRNVFDMILGENAALVDLVTPQGIVADGRGVVYVADPGAGVVHRYDVVRQTAEYLRDAGPETMLSPACVALDSAGNVFVSDTIRAKVFKYSSSGRFLGEFTRGSHKFLRPAGIAVSHTGEIIVVDALAHKLKIFKADGSFIREFPDEGANIALHTPSYVAVGRDGLIYVTDSMNFRVQVYDLLGAHKRTIGEIGDSPGSFGRPKGIGVDSDSHVYVVDGMFDNFQIFDSNGDFLLYLGKTGGGRGEFSIPGGIFIDNDDRIYVSDTFNRRIQIFQYLKEGAK